GESSAGDEARQSLLGGTLIHPYEGSHEQAQTSRLLRRPADVVGPPNSALGEHPLQLAEVVGGERLVHAQLGDRDVIEVLAQECARLGDKLALVGADGKAR